MEQLSLIELDIMLRFLKNRYEKSINSITYETSKKREQYNKIVVRMKLLRRITSIEKEIEKRIETILPIT